jgi:hypothetical protein
MANHTSASTVMSSAMLAPMLVTGSGEGSSVVPLVHAWLGSA